MSIEVALVAPRALAGERAAWERLADEAIDPNPFYEPAFLLPALRHLARPRERVALLVLRRSPRTAVPGPDAAGRGPGGGRGGALVGLLPVARSAAGRLPWPALGSWQHRHAFHGTPLLHRDAADEALRALLAWSRRGGHAGPLFRLDGVAGDGAFAALLDRALAELDIPAFEKACARRPLHRPREDAPDLEAHLAAVASGHRRRRLRRWLRQLGGEGDLRVVEARDAAGCEDLTRRFLELEALGWKGAAGSAMASRRADRDFVREMHAGLAARGRLLLLALELDGTPLAVRSSILTAGDGSFAFKTAYHPDRARFSPGVLIEIELLRRMIEGPGPRWQDSCVETGGSPLHWLWRDARGVRSVWLPAHGAVGALLARGLPLAARLARRGRGGDGARA